MSQRSHGRGFECGRGARGFLVDDNAKVIGLGPNVVFVMVEQYVQNRCEGYWSLDGCGAIDSWRPPWC